MKKSKKAALLLIPALAIILVGIYLLSSSQPTSSPPDPRVTRLTRIIQLLDERINQSTSAEARQANTQRRDYFAWQATELAQPTTDALILMQEKQTAIVKATETASQATPLPAATRETGLFSGAGFVRGLSEEAKLSPNYYIASRDGEYITVTVGNLRADPSQGAVYIFSPRANEWEKYRVPEKVGELSIISGDGSELKISGDAGKVFSFN